MLLDRATRANEKAGPFEALFVVGSVSESEEEAFFEALEKGESQQQQQRAGAGVMKTYVLDPRVARRLEERAEVSLVDAKEFEGGGEGNDEGNDDDTVGNIEGLNPKGGVKQIVVDGEEETSNVFVSDETGRILDVDSVERRRREHETVFHSHFTWVVRSFEHEGVPRLRRERPVSREDGESERGVYRARRGGDSTDGEKIERMREHVVRGGRTAHASVAERRANVVEV